MTVVTDAAAATRPRLPLGAVGRLMVCNGSCRMLVDVLEASMCGPHQHLDPATYTCGECLTTGPFSEDKKGV